MSCPHTCFSASPTRHEPCRRAPELARRGTEVAPLHIRRYAGSACARGCDACVARVFRKRTPWTDAEQATPAQEEVHMVVEHLEREVIVERPVQRFEGMRVSWGGI